MKLGRRGRIAVVVTAVVTSLMALSYWLRRYIFARLLRLPPPRVRKVAVERNVRVPMADGVTLAADWYRPVTGDGPGPAVLIRTPYNKRDPILAAFAAQRFAERGYHVVVQDVRGQFESDGTFEPMTHEAADGAATLRWLAAQPWCNGRIGMWGPSYLGYVQWAAAGQAPEMVQALVPMVTSAHFKSVVLPDGVLAFDLQVRWHYLLQLMADMKHPLEMMSVMAPGRLEQDLAPAYRHLPASGAVEQLPVELEEQYRPVAAFSDEDAAFWDQVDQRKRMEAVQAPVHLVGGWYDIFAREIVEDYRRLREAGQDPHLTMGPWSHADNGLLYESLRQATGWFDAHLRDGSPPVRKPVRVYVMGKEAWREMDAWPPAAAEREYYLQPAGGLAPEMPETSAGVSTFRYDPADPPPSVGGPLLTPPSGPTDNRALEAREDVLVFTSAPLLEAVEVMGAIRLRLFVRSSVAHTDFTGRLCDVYPDGRSINICDGLFRVTPETGVRHEDGTREIEIDMWLTANCFLPGHRIRLQVSSAMHPRYLRNLNVPDQTLETTSFVVAEQTVLHDVGHPSVLLLPVVS